MPIKRYPSILVYQEIILLKHWFKGNWVVENVKPYYEPLIKPTVNLGRHIFWSNFDILKKRYINVDVARSNSEQLSKDLDLPIPRCQKATLLLRNCVHPTMAKYIFDCAFKKKQLSLNELKQEAKDGK